MEANQPMNAHYNFTYSASDQVNTTLKIFSCYILSLLTYITFHALGFVICFLHDIAFFAFLFSWQYSILGYSNLYLDNNIGCSLLLLPLRFILPWISLIYILIFFHIIFLPWALTDSPVAYNKNSKCVSFSFRLFKILT